MYRKEYYENNKEKFKEYNKRHYEKFKDEVREHQKKYYEENKEKIYAKQQEWRTNNRDKCTKYAHDGRHKRIEKLKQKGVINPWGVVMRGSKPKYEKEV